jgi:ribose/xylose/arabinose/galactoside ABC-type transport system permease subunit
MASERHWDAWLSMAMATVAGFDRRFQRRLGRGLGLPSFIATLGMLAALRGAGNALVGGVQTYAKNTDQFFYKFFTGNFPDTRLPNVFVIMLILTLIAALVLATTK